MRYEWTKGGQEKKISLLEQYFDTQEKRITTKDLQTLMDFDHVNHTKKYIINTVYMVYNDTAHLTN